MSMRRELADAVYNAGDCYHPYPEGKDIERVEFRRGCAEIEVTYKGHMGFQEQVVVDAAPILSLMLQNIIDSEVGL